MKKIFWCAIVVIISSVSNAQTTIDISPEKDNSMYSESENSNGLGELFAGQTCSDNSRRALLEFDIRAMVPFGATITDVSLILNMDNVSPGAGTQDYGLHRVGLEWGEGTSDGGDEGAVAVAPDATWIDAMFETSGWDDAGGDFYDIASATLSIGEVLTDYTWTSTGMITNVQNWLDYPGSNHGWILIGDELAICSDRRFGSKDVGVAPVLEVTYTCADGAAVAICHGLTLYLDDAGEVTITAEDLDAGSAVPCDGELTLSVSETIFTCDDILEEVDAVPSMIISGVYDCSLPLGLPKGVEVYIINDIADLSLYGIGFANNGGGTDGIEFTFPEVSASAGTYLYVASENLGFAQWFGFDPDYKTGNASINGDDAIELFYEEVVIDIFGDIDVDGTGEDWEYTDGWAYRMLGTGLDGDVFDVLNWIYSGTNELDGETTNATAVTPVPIGTYSTAPTSGFYVDFSASGDLGSDMCLASIIVLDTLPPLMSCVAAVTYVLDETGIMMIDPSDLDAGTEDGCGIDELSISMDAFTCENEGENEVWLFATDVYGNSDSCMVLVTIDASEVILITENELLNPTCFGFEDGQIDITVAGGTPTYSFDWDNDGTGDFDDFEDLVPLGGGTYEVVVMDENGCQAMATFDLEEPAEIEVDGVITNETCPGAADGGVDLLITGGTEPYIIEGAIIDLEAGEYSITINDSEGCSVIYDFVIGLDAEIDLTVTESGTDLMSNEDGAAYQWITCPDFGVIDGATDQNYAPDAAGTYAVIVTVGECSDTTACFSFGFDNIDEFNKFSVALYPSPTNGLLNVALGNLNGQAVITVIDLKGSIVLEKSTSILNEQIDLSAMENGIYFVRISSAVGTITKRVSVSK